MRKAVESGKFGDIPLKKYNKPPAPGLKKVVIGPLVPPNLVPPNLQMSVKLDDLWLSSYFVTDPTHCPSWSGFNQTVCEGQFEMSRIDILPFVNHDPNQPDTLYSALSYVHDLSLRYTLGVVSVKFDQTLYIKAAEIVELSADLSHIFVRLGGFHLVMSYLGAA